MRLLFRVLWVLLRPEFFAARDRIERRESERSGKAGRHCQFVREWAGDFELMGFGSPNQALERTAASRLVFDVDGFMNAIRESLSALSAAVAQLGRSAEMFSKLIPDHRGVSSTQTPCRRQWCNALLK